MGYPFLWAKFKASLALLTIACFATGKPDSDRNWLVVTLSFAMLTALMLSSSVNELLRIWVPDP